jgi:hypothetical protein
MAERARPAELIAEAVEQHGTPAVRAWCERLVLGEAVAGDRGEPDVALLGGTTGWAPFWSRVWGIRAYRYLGATPRTVLVHALGDDAWRVREHALAIVRDEAAAELLPQADAALDDPVARVRVAAMRAVAELGESEHAERIRRMDLVDVPPDRVDRALARLSERLDRPV